MKKLTLILTLLFSTLIIQAQISMPAPSPLSTVTQKVGLVDVSITYSRPGAKERKVFGDLVPYGQLWRTGANKCTKISVSDSVKIGDKKFGKGDYSLFTIPGETEWTVIINKNADLGGVNGYKETEDVVRLKVAPVANSFTENFTINFNNLQSNKASIELTWENIKVAFPIEVDVDSKVMKNIETALTIPANSYYQAATYYYDTNRDSNKALEWVNKALEIGGDKFWMLRTKSLIQARLGDYKGAIATAEKSRDLAAKDEGGSGFVKMNEASIKEWNGILGSSGSKNNGTKSSK